MESGRSVGHLDELLVVADPIALAREAAKRVVAIAEEAVARCGRFTVALAGGSTPKRLYALLAAEPYRTRLPWQKAHIFWGDERAVPPEHPNSNFGMARATLLGRVPIPSDQIHRMQAERPDLDAAARDYETEMKEKKARVEDALHATRAAMEEGIVAGGGVALLRCIPVLEKMKLSADEQVGVNIVKKALEEPIRQIVNNAGLEASVIVDKVKASDK